MVQAFRFSEEQGLCATGTADRVARHLEAAGLPTRVSQIPGGRADPDELLRLMGQDKKVRQGKLTFILVRGIGQSFIARDVSPEAVRSFLANDIAR
jgi:3-dehydroquinate synthetase